MNKVPFTKQGYGALTAELHKLGEDRIQAVHNLKTARDLGDLSENAAYRVARSKLSSIDSRTRKLQKIIDAAYVVKPKSIDEINFGSTVILQAEKETITYQIVHTLEANIAQGKISTYSPIGKAMMGKRKGDTIEVRTPGGEKKYKVVSIRN